MICLFAANAIPNNQRLRAAYDKHKLCTIILTLVGINN